MIHWQCINMECPFNASQLPIVNMPGASSLCGICMAPNLFKILYYRAITVGAIKGVNLTPYFNIVEFVILCPAPLYYEANPVCCCVALLYARNTEHTSRISFAT